MSTYTKAAGEFTLDSYRGSPLRAKIAYAEALLGWAETWLKNSHDMEGQAPFEGLAHAKRLRRMAHRIEVFFEEAAIAQLYHQEKAYAVGEGYTAVLRPPQERRGWDHAGVMTALIDAVTEQMTARHPSIPRRAAQQMITEAMWTVHKVGRIDWRSTDLREFGVDPDDFSTHTEVPARIDLRGDASYVRARTANRKVHLP